MHRIDDETAGIMWSTFLTFHFINWTSFNVIYCNGPKVLDRQVWANNFRIITAMFTGVRFFFIFQQLIKCPATFPHPICGYLNDPKFSDRLVWTNGAERSSLIRVYTVGYSVFIFWTHYSMVKPPCSNFRMITAFFFGVRICRIFTFSKE